MMTENSPLTVAGAAAALGDEARTAFPFDPPRGTVPFTMSVRARQVNELTRDAQQRGSGVITM
jgi:hypothetical protein